MVLNQVLNFVMSMGALLLISTDIGASPNFCIFKILSKVPLCNHHSRASLRLKNLTCYNYPYYKGNIQISAHKKIMGGCISPNIYMDIEESKLPPEPKLLAPER